MLAYALDFRPHEIIYLGDYHDLYSVSSYAKNPEKLAHALDEELAVGIDLMSRTEALLKPRKSYFLIGNHEHRLDRYLNEAAPIVKRLFPPLREILGLSSKTTLIPYDKFLEFDDLLVHHGIVCGRNCCVKMLDKLSSNIIFGHTHKLQSASKTMLGKTIRAYSAGWLGDIKEVDYAQAADYQSGFATGTFAKSGKWDIQLHHIQSDNSVIAPKKQLMPIPLLSKR